jgi:serine/threonine-protein kinase
MIGQTINHYQITAKLGAGGMGEVYLAQDTQLGRQVAVKLLSIEKSSEDESRQRFIHEARAQAMLNHPNIATFYEVGELDGRAFIVMEYIEGRSLLDTVNSEKLSPADILGLIVQAAEGLQAAHEQGIIHRDIKPENIMVTPKGLVKITDFGLARWKGATTITKSGTLMGTVSYMSPEQAEGRKVDHRSDIFSLGVVLYELICRQRPFAGDAEAAVLYELTSQAPEPLARYCRDAPDELNRIVMKCLAKRPDERYQTCADLIADLRISSQGTDTAPRDYHAPGRKMLAVLPFENMGSAGDEYFADGMTEEITSRLAAIRGLGVISRTSAMQYKGTSKRIKEIAAELGVDYILEGSVRWSRDADGQSRLRITPQLIQASDDTHLWSERYDRIMDDVFAIQSEIADRVIEQLEIELHPSEMDTGDRQQTENLEAYHAYLRGRFFAGKPHFMLENWTEAVRSFKRAVELDPHYAIAHAELSRAHARLYYLRADLTEERQDLARRSIERALELAPDSPEVRLAFGYYHFWARRDAERALEEFAVAARGIPEGAEVLEAKGEALRHLGRWHEALDQFREGCKLNPRNASVAVELSETNWCMRRYTEAAAISDEAIALAPDQVWPYLIKVFNFWSWKAALDDSRAALESMPQKGSWTVWAWFWQEVYEKRYTEALDRLSADGSEWILLKTWARPKALLRAYVHELTGESDLAREQYTAAKTLLEQEVQEHPDDPRYRSSLAIASAALGHKERAVQMGKRAVELYPVSVDAFYGLPYVIDLAHVHAIIGEKKLALDLIDTCLSSPSWLSVAYLQIDPRWDHLRDHPGFKELLEKGHTVF